MCLGTELMEREIIRLGVGYRTIHLGVPATSRIWVRAVPQQLLNFRCVDKVF